MKRLLLFTFYLLLFTSTLSAQRRYDEILRQVEQNNPMLQAARQKCEADRLEAHVGLLLPDPQVEVALFRGDPAEQGTRWDLRVTQSFELPSVYVRRARLRDLREHAAELDYQTLHNTLMHEAQLLCAELIYLRGVADVLDRQSSTAIRVMQIYEERMRKGDCSVLDYNRAQMNMADIQNRAGQAIIKYNECYTDLCVLMGVEYCDFRQESYDTVIIPVDDPSWYDTVERRTPRLLALQNVIDTRQQELQLSRSLWLPSMSVGYASETVTGAAFRGVTVGMSLPIWSQPRAVRQAKVSLEAAQQELTGQRTMMLDETRCQMHRLIAIQHALNEMRMKYVKYNSTALLDKAFEAGELNLEQYLLQKDFYIQQELALWDLAYELEKGYIDLYSITL